MAFSKSIFSTFAILAFFFALTRAIEVSHDGRAIKIDGERKILFSGSIHYPRSTPQMWPDLIAKAKEGGLDAIETYVFWNVHEPRRREYNFEGNLDIIRFIKEIQNAGLYAILRIGPYVCAEWNLGGLPAWLLQIPGMEFRTDNQPFKKEMKNFTTLIVNMVKEQGLLAPQGGPIILTQIENEYGNIQGPYGEAGKRYINWCAKLAESLHVGVPWIMCQQEDAPQPMINACNGFYCNEFRPNNKNSPKIWTENWTGWFKAWGASDPHRPAEDVAYAVARFFQTNGTLQNYYMYHGGTNFGRTTGGPYITTSYDYDAPLDEYGNIKQPKWGHLKELHASIKMMEKAILFGDMRCTSIGNGITVSKFFGEHITPGCLLSNENTTTDISVEFQGNSYFLPAWSVSILPDCNEEVYNTAKVGTQTNVMIKKPNQAEDQSKLSWSWRPEVITKHAHGNKKPLFTARKLFEQVTTTADVSDYLWYFTSVNCEKGNMTLRVNTTGHGLHVFVNGAHIGFQYSNNSHFGFVFEHPISLIDGDNHIALLSTTVGLKNYGAYYEKMPAGIVGGPVQLIEGNTTIDLSKNKWSYMIGLDGEERQLHLESAIKGLKWSTKLPDRNRPFTWYKATFQAPLGSDPVVVDLQGTGKGAAWVNGKTIGRFWPQYTAKEDGCTPCDYRGVFNSDRTCNTGCGESSQRWYHVPREFLNPGKPNTLTLFEEIGGNPSSVNFQTIAVGKICGNVFERETLNLTCEGSTISKIEFASFGNPQGSCQAFNKGSCDAQGTFAKVQQECVGKESCSIKADESLLGACGQCENDIKKLAVQAVCS